MTVPERLPRPPSPPVPGAEPPPGETVELRFGGLSGEIASGYLPAEPEIEIRRLIDPGAAIESLHWGRNYLYKAELSTTGGPVAVVVKQFCESPGRAALEGGAGRASKAMRSWRTARAVAAAGIPTPEPVLVIDAEEPRGFSCFVCRHLEGTFEARYLLRAAAEGRQRELFPMVDLERFFDALGALVRRLHEAGFWHRDLSVGNVLIRPAKDPVDEPELFLIDLNRARRVGRLSLSQRIRDFCRLALFRRQHRDRLLDAYFGEPAGAWPRVLFSLYHHAFQVKHRIKKPLRWLRKKLAGLVRSRGTHAHIPAAPSDAETRDRVVWDELSDQPHLHAGRWQKLKVRLADLGPHLEEAATIAGSLPRIARRYRQLMSELYRQPVPFAGAGIALRPWPEAPGALLQAVDDLGLAHTLVRLHPWDADHTAEQELARELAQRGKTVAYSLPQNRDLVKDPARWRSAIEEIAERFTPYGLQFQIGQAINRSKWGIWRRQEYVDLVLSAIEILKRHPGVEILGPSVIDFEHHITASVLNLKRPGLDFDIVSSLLYVDRRGAPENRQASFDTVGKTVLLRAIAETSRNGAERCWITEVNWPLWEGPHSPAGKGVSVDEESQADYLVRYYLATLGTGLVERVYWWQLIARGYGLILPAHGSLTRRPSFAALVTLERQLAGHDFLGPLPGSPQTRLYHFRGPSGAADGVTDKVVAWSIDRQRRSLVLPKPIAGIVERDGEASAGPPQREVEVGPSPRYLSLVEPISSDS